jgi:CubicO group peptidase (beta-lactamase class C family)
MKKLAWLVFVACCLLFSFQPMRYLLADGPVGLLNSKPLDNSFYLFSFYTHISLGGIPLLIGWIQFSQKIRNRYLKFHRIVGKIYVASILVGGPFAFYLGFFVYGGLTTQIGFTFGAFIWILTTFLGYSTIRKGNVAKHREYMMYSYAGTCAAIVLRLILPPLMMITSFKVAYGISVWMSWVPSVLLVYLFLHHKKALVRFYKKLYLKQVAISIVSLALIAFSLSFTSAHTWFYKSSSFEGTPLKEKASNETSSFTDEKIKEVTNYLEKESETTAMMVLENGQVVFKYGDVSEISYTASVRKSILSILYGKYVDNGTIDLQQTLGALGIDEDDGLLPIEKQASIEHVITARSGVFHPAANEGYDTKNMKKRGKEKPGEYFIYNNWDFNVAGFILEKASRNTVPQEIENQLAIPLEFEDWHVENQWKTENKKLSRYPAQHLHLSTRDMAKIGQLMLQKGQWNGKQLISKEWIQKITTTVTPKDTVNVRYDRDGSSPVQHSYGYLWWLFERFYDNPDFEGAYTAIGAHGHYITVIPKRNVVVVHKTTRDLLTVTGLSDRASTPSWRYWWILRTLMLNRKSISTLEPKKSINEIVDFLKIEYQNSNSEYAISERLINEYALSLAERGKHEEAIQLFELNLRLYPNHGYYTHRIYQYYGKSLLALGRKEKARVIFEKALEHHPQDQESIKALELL